MEVGVNFTRGAATALIPPNLVASISPATTSQATPGAVVLTGSATGGTGAQTWAWSAKYADGSSADGALSALVGSPVTLTTTTPGQSVRVVATATDAAGQTSAASAMVAVEQPAAPTLSGPARQTQTYVGAASVTFTGASGYGALSYSATLSKPSGSAATLSGSGLGPYTFTTDAIGAYTVTLTLTDALGRTAAATGIVSTEVQGSIWSTTADIDFTAVTPASRTTDGTFSVGAYTATFTRGTSNTGSGGVGASGLFCTVATGTANAQTVVAVPVTSSKRTLILMKVTAPTLSGNVASARACISNAASVTTGTQILPVIFKNNSGGGFDVTTVERLSGTAQGTRTLFTNTSNPGTVIVAFQLETRHCYYTAFDQDTYPTPDQLNTGQWFPMKSLSLVDTTPDDYILWFGSTVYVGVEMGAAPGSMYTTGVRVLESTPGMG